ncbi:hypothetical protein ACJX0J_023540, partial [Zea mays]
MMFFSNLISCLHLCILQKRETLLTDLSLVYDKATCILFSIPFPYLGSVFYHIGNRACFMCGLLSFAISKENMDQIATPHIPHILKCVWVKFQALTCDDYICLGEWALYRD